MLLTATAPTTRHSWAAPGALIGLFAVVFAIPVVNSIRLAAGDTLTPASRWGDQIAAIEGAVFSSAVALLVVCRWLPRHAPDVMADVALRRLPTARTVLASTAYVAIAAISTWVGSRLPDAAPADPIAGGVGGRLVGMASAVSAGITEELVLVALAAAVVAQVSRDRPRLVVPMTLALLLVLRWSIHLQHGWASVFVLVWVPAAYALYRRADSIWPLVIGHAVYDVVLVLTH